MPDLVMTVDTALSEVPVNLMPLLDDTDFKTRETAIAYNAAGMDLVWNFVTVDGAFTQTAVTPTTAGTHDWTHQGDGMYTIEIPDSGGASINNNALGFGWFTGVATGVLPWRGPVIQFSPSNVVNSLVVGSDKLQVHADEITAGLITATAIATGAIDADAIAADAIAAAKIATGAITAAKFAAGAIDAAALAADAITAAKVAADVGGEIADAVWDEATSGHTTAGTYGKLTVDNLDTAVSSRATTTSGGSIVTGTDNKVLISANAGAFPAAAIQAIWDALTSALTTASSIGKLLVDNINATISSRATQTSVDTIDDFLDTEIAAIKAKTDNLPADPADASDIAALIDALPTAAENAAALLDLSNGIETSITPRQAIRLILAASAGKISGAATTTVVIRNVGDSKDRITATVDSSGNRSAVTTDGT